MMQKKKICLVIPSLQAGGMERVMSELAGYFATKDYLEIHLVLYGITREQFYKIPATIIVHKPGFRFNNSYRIFNTVKTIFYLRKTIRKINPDSVLSFGEYWNSLVLIALYGLNFPLYVSDRCQPDKSLGEMHDFLRKCLYPRASGIIAQTTRAKEIYSLQKLNRNIEAIGNPVRLITGTGNVEREKIVLTIGRLIKTKNHDKLIEIFLKISKPGWKLVIVGYDHLKQKISENLKRIISDNNAEDIVLIEGKKADVEIYYLKSSIFAFSSTSEGFPNVILEAMNSGLPVVSFNCIAGPSDIITDEESGFLVPVNDYVSFRERLEQLMSDELLRNSMGSKAKESLERFSLENIGEKYLNFIMGT